MRHTTRPLTRQMPRRQAFLLQLAPPLPKARYRHNDIELRCVCAYAQLCGAVLCSSLLFSP